MSTILQDFPVSPYFDDGVVTLYCGDAMQIIPELGIRFAACITDPPYGQTALDWDRWVSGWPEVVAKVTDQLWCFGTMRMFLEHAHDFAAWKFGQDLVWEKQNGSGFNVDRFNRVHEQMVHWYRGEWGALHISPQRQAGLERPTAGIRSRGQTPHRRAIGDRGYEFTNERAMRSVMFCQNMHGKGTVNETQKPEGLLSPLIEYSVPVGGVVLDPFAGSGTTGVRAKALGRRAVLIERRPSQCDAIVERLRQQFLPM